MITPVADRRAIHYALHDPTADNLTVPFELMRTKDLEGIVAKRLDDPYNPRVRWLKINNPGDAQKQRRGESFNLCLK